MAITSILLTLLHGINLVGGRWDCDNVAKLEVLNSQKLDLKIIQMRSISGIGEETSMGVFIVFLSIPQGEWIKSETGRNQKCQQLFVSSTSQ